MTKQNTTTVAGQQSVSLPDKFLCRVCRKWRLTIQYSNKELKGYTNKMIRGARLTPISAQLRCRCCAGGPLHELECLGPCGETKPINAFSKSARQNGGSNWCMACTLWKESAEPSLSIEAPPASSSSEKKFYISKSLEEEYSDPEAGDGVSDDDDFNSGPRVTRGYENTSRPTTPSTIQNFEESNSAQDFNSTAYSIYDKDDDVDESDTQTSASNLWENFSFESTTIDHENSRPVTFNAWDSSGQQHTINANYSTKERFDDQPPSNPNSGWAKPAGSRNARRTCRTGQSSRQLSKRNLNFPPTSDCDGDLIDL